MRQFVFMLINTLEGHCGLMEDSVLMSRSDTLTASEVVPQCSHLLDHRLYSAVNP